MKKINSLLLIVFCVFLGACKKEKNDEMIVIKDCTGMYLRFDNKDYHVCNINKVSPYANNTKVNAKFRRVKECETEAGKIICQMYHEDEGWIEVTEINKN